MSENASPYAEPVSREPQRSPSGNTVQIVAILAVTALLIFGGLIGLGFYAVERLADQFAETEVWDGDESNFAVEFAIEQSAPVRDRIGQIDSVEHQTELTYHEDAGPEDYFYRVRGSSGEVLVVVQFSDSDTRWFKSVKLVEGEGVDDPQTPLPTREVPFDSEWSKRVYEILAAEEGNVAESLNTGEIEWVFYDYEESVARSNDQELLFDVHGSEGTERIVARFEDPKFLKIEALHRVDDDGQSSKQLYVDSGNAVP